MGTAIRLMDPSQDEFLAKLESKTGKPNHFFRTMANRPEILKAFVPLYGSIMGPGSVDRRTKELVYLTVSFANECAYCTAAHRASGAKAGLTEQDINDVRLEQDGKFTPAEKAAIQYARELTTTADGRDTRAALDDYYSSEQVVEITLIAAMANFTNRFNNGLDLQPE